MRSDYQVCLTKPLNLASCPRLAPRSFDRSSKGMPLVSSTQCRGTLPYSSYQCSFAATTSRYIIQCKRRCLPSSETVNLQSTIPPLTMSYTANIAQILSRESPLWYLLVWAWSASVSLTAAMKSPADRDDSSQLLPGNDSGCGTSNGARVPLHSYPSVFFGPAVTRPARHCCFHC
jgi:hypothetical protein